MTTEILTFRDAVNDARRDYSSNGSSLANLFSVYNDINANYLCSGLDLRMKKALENSYKDRSFDLMCVQHAYVVFWVYREKDFVKAFEDQHAMAQEFMRHFQSQGGSFDLPCLYQICRDLRALARSADTECAKKQRKPFAMDECARFLNKAFTACIQHKSSGKESKRWGVYYMIGLVFKTYFEINTLSLCKNILRATGAMKDLMPLERYPRAHQVTFKYYTGVLAFLDDKFEQSNVDLTYALQKCPAKHTRNQELILKHLIPLRLLNGDLPSPTLLDRFPRLHELYQPFVQALKTGNVKHFDEALVRGERRLVESGTYGVVERVREICLRGLFNKVWLINGKQKIVDIAKFRRALSVSGVVIDSEEVECLLAGMVFKGYMKGYIAHQQQKVVLSDVLSGKAHPFPSVKSVRSTAPQLPL
ncbi:hypothetical protein E3P99_01455 [Wallemia hederae]|uniref:PCI domain-containing protein n=1 Tax=Wallemia hederae TaxID=1540922 RepID=A0A4V4LTL9_9BASI|nr:hypothetical protein E3P99_01455 [Wallemia hederae]